MAPPGSTTLSVGRGLWEGGYVPHRGLGSVFSGPSARWGMLPPWLRVGQNSSLAPPPVGCWAEHRAHTKVGVLIYLLPDTCIIYLHTGIIHSASYRLALPRSRCAALGGCFLVGPPRCVLVRCGRGPCGVSSCKKDITFRQRIIGRGLSRVCWVYLSVGCGPPPCLASVGDLPSVGPGAAAPVI